MSAANPQPPPGGQAPWQPARVVDFVLRFGPDLGPAMRSVINGLKGGRLGPEDLAREACRALARAVGGATHAYVNAAGQGPLTVRLPTNAPADEGAVIAMRLTLNVPMTQPIDNANGQQVAGLIQALLGLPRGSIANAELCFPEVSRDARAPLLTTLNSATLPGHKLCPFCRNPMPDYEVQCASCGARART